MHEEVFLAIGDDSVASYMSPHESSEYPGEDTGFILAVDADFDPEQPDDHADESPGYSGVLRILGNLVWGDLFAMMTAETQFPRELWPLAMDHPEQVYVGWPVPSQVQRWRKSTTGAP
jgi:hypothetical protein